MDIKLLSIDSIGLSVRSTNALQNANVHTVGDMLGYTCLLYTSPSPRD